MGTTLHPGAEVRIYRDGTELASSVLIAPVDHHLEVRHLNPGSYVARDGMGNEVAFVVDPQRESAVLRVQGGHDTAKPSGPGGALVDESPFQHVGARESSGDGPYLPDVEFAARPKAAPEDDVPVPGEPGSALIEEVADPRPSLEAGQKVRRVNRAPENVEPGATAKNGAAVRPRRRAKAKKVRPVKDATEATAKQAARAASKKK